MSGVEYNQNIDNQKEAWEKARREVHQFKDKLGMPVDRGIVETVAILRLLGIHTTSSCAGHSDRVTGGPYVKFASVHNDHVFTRMKEAGDRTGPEYKRIFDEGTRNSLIEWQKIIPFLDSFYADRIVSYNQRIIISGFGPTDNCLMCQGADLGCIFDNQERNKLLKKQR